jgi:excinuclease UvrABC nuclease subunit
MTFTVYRFYSEEDRLLYVGSTKHPRGRLRDHLLDKEWAQDICHVTFEHYTEPLEMAQAEIEAIKKEKPLHNIQHSRETKNAFWGTHPHDVEERERIKTQYGEQQRLLEDYLDQVEGKYMPVDTLRELWPLTEEDQT